jgi:hypothetical protein
MTDACTIPFFKLSHAGDQTVYFLFSIFSNYPHVCLTAQNKTCFKMSVLHLCQPHHDSRASTSEVKYIFLVNSLTQSQGSIMSLFGVVKMLVSNSRRLNCDNAIVLSSVKTVPYVI